MAARYVINNAVLTEPGTYSYRLLDTDAAKRWLDRPFHSRLRYDATSEAIERVTGVRCPVDRTPVRMYPGDEALVFRLRVNMARLERRDLTAEFIVNNAEIGLLRRLS